MSVQFNGKSFEINSIRFQVLAGTSIGLLLGFAFNWFSPVQVFAGVALIFLAFAVIKRPEIGLLGILIATSSILYENQLPKISVGISLYSPDVLLLVLLGLTILRLLLDPSFKVIRTPLDWPFFFFIMAPILSTIIALYHGSIETELVTRAVRFRVYSYYLIFFLVTNLVREERQLKFLLKSMYILGIIVALAIVLQFVLGSSVQILSGRVEILETRGTMYEDITRVLPPGWPVVFISLIVSLSMLALEETTALTRIRFLQVGLFALALIFTFLRSYWTMLFMVYLAMVYLFKGRHRKKLIRLGMVSAILAKYLSKSNLVFCPNPIQHIFKTRFKRFEGQIS